MKVNNRPYDIFRFKVKHLVGKGTQAKVKYKNYQFPLPEVLAIANSIGYDLESDDDEYFWFLKRLLIQDMPLGWIKETSIMGEAYYHNTQLNVTTCKHPFTKEYRKLFAQIINNKKNTQKQVAEDLHQHTITQVKSKRALFISSKDSKSSTTAQEEPLKTQSTQEESQLLDIKDVLNTLTQKSTNNYQQVGEIQSLVKALSFYERLIGLNIKKPPHFLKNHPFYLQMTPEELIKLAFKYKIDLKTEIDLLWVVRMTQCLPLPPFWQKQVNNTVQEFSAEDRRRVLIYRDLESNASFTFHPCALFIIKLLNKLRLEKMTKEPEYGNKSTFSRSTKRKNSFTRINQNQATVQLSFMDNLNRIYKCSGKDIFELSTEQVNLENKNHDDFFTYDTQTIEKEFQSLTKVFEQQVSSFIHESKLTDSEIQALAEQCKLSTTRETYLYKSLYEFLSERYLEQDQQWNQYELERTKAQNMPDPTLVCPKIWIFRKTIEGPYYWIEKHTKEISKVFPYIKDLRKLIEEIKVTNTAVEQYVHSKGQVRVLKKVENYMKLKAYSTQYIQKLITISTAQERNNIESENEISGMEDGDFLDRVIEDLDIEGEVSKEQLLQWMFAWPYELSDEFFSKKDEIQAKINEDLSLIRQKAEQRKEVLQRMIKKINVVNRLSKSFGGKGISQNANFLSEVQMRRIQEEELLQKIKKTKAVIGVSDIRIRKKLRVLLSKAMQDESERDKLQELELLEKELLESGQKKRQDQLKQKLKQQLGLDDSGIDEDDEEDSQEDPDKAKGSMMTGESITVDSNESESGEEDGNDEPDEPEDDSFTFQGNHSKEKDESTHQSQDDEQKDDAHFDANLITIDEQNKLDSQKEQEEFEKAQASKILSEHSAKEETLEQRRQRLERQILDKKLKELTESSVFIKRVRRKLKQMNISKTQDDLKKKIIQLKMLHLKVRSNQNDQGNNPDDEDNDEDDGQDDFDFLSEIIKIQEHQSSSENSINEDSSVSMIDKISEVDSQLEIDTSTIMVPNLLPLPDLIINRDFKSNDDSPYKRNAALLENQFYEDFVEIKKMETLILKRKNTVGISLSQQNQQEADDLQDEIGEDEQSPNTGLSKGSKGSPRLKLIRRSSTIVSKYDEMIRQGSMKISNSPVKQSSGGNSRRNSSPFMNYERNGEEIDPFSEYDDKTGINYMTVVVPGSPNFDANELERRRTARKDRLENIQEEDGEDTTRNKKYRSPQSKLWNRKTMDGEDKFKIEMLKTRRFDSAEHMTQFKVLKGLANQDYLPVMITSSNDELSNIDTIGIDHVQEEDAEFAKFLKQIKVFDDSPDILLDIATMDPFTRFIYDYYITSVGDYKLPKDQLKLCDKKFTQALNIDSFLFTAQKLRIKVLAQRETDLMWIAQEYLIHPNPSVNDYQGDKSAAGENPVEKIKTYYFKQMVKEHRKMRVDKISTMIKGSKELQQLIEENSWVTIYDKQEYYKYNFQTKEREPIQQEQAMEQAAAQMNQAFQNQMREGFLNFLKKRGLGQQLTAAQEQMIQQQAQEQTQIQMQQQQQQQMMLQIARESRLSDSVKSPYLDSSKPKSQVFFPKSVSKEIEKLQLQQYASMKQAETQELVNVKDFKLDNGSYGLQQKKKLTTQMLPKLAPFSMPQQLYNTFESKGERPNSKQLSTLSNRPGTNFSTKHQRSDDPKNTPQSMMPRYDPIDEFLPSARQSMKRDSNKGSISHRALLQEVPLFKFPAKSIKRVILNNNQENFARMQMRNFERSQSTLNFDSNCNNVCYKYLDKHLYNTIKSPLEEMNHTLQSSSNFNSRIFKRLQDNVKLKPFSYLSQANLQHNLNQEQEELDLEKTDATQKLLLAQNLAGTMNYFYFKLLSIENQDFIREHKHAVDMTEGVMSARLNSRQKNDFRNMSPRSLHRWASKSQMNREFAIKSGVLQRRTGKSSYGKLRRAQEDKMTFSTIPQQL